MSSAGEFGSSGQARVEPARTVAACWSVTFPARDDREPGGARTRDGR